LHGQKVCPNYFLSQNALVIDTRNLYSAHEMVQMVPISGFNIYRRMQTLNDWVGEFLPNSVQAIRSASPLERRSSSLKTIEETLLRLPFVDPIEKWEMQRKIQRFRQAGDSNPEASFSADWCKGHFDGHFQRTAEAFSRRLEKLNLEISMRSERA
jgi:hypothetical protein